MSSFANARTGLTVLARVPDTRAAASLIKTLLYAVANVAMFPVSLRIAGQPSAPGTGGGKCLWLNAACGYFGIAHPAFPARFRSQYFHRAQFGRTRRWIVPNFFLGRPHHVTRENVHVSVLRQRLKTLLDSAVLERHERQQHRPPTRLHQLGYGGQ